MMRSRTGTTRFPSTNELSPRVVPRPDMKLLGKIGVARRGTTHSRAPKARELSPYACFLDGKATAATGYACLAWEKEATVQPRLLWVPPCRKKLERKSDYHLP